VPDDKVRCLKDAAFYERTLNLSDAAQRLRTFLKATEEPLPGASGIFQNKLRERLQGSGEPTSPCGSDSSRISISHGETSSALPFSPGRRW
jgi:hypothetical protein